MAKNHVKKKVAGRKWDLREIFFKTAEKIVRKFSPKNWPPRLTSEALTRQAGRKKDDFIACNSFGSFEEVEEDDDGFEVNSLFEPG